MRKQALDIIIHPKPMFAMNILILETLPPKVHAYTWFERRKTLYQSNNTAKKKPNCHWISFVGIVFHCKCLSLMIKVRMNLKWILLIVVNTYSLTQKIPQTSMLYHTPSLAEICNQQ